MDMYIIKMKSNFCDFARECWISHSLGQMTVSGLITDIGWVSLFYTWWALMSSELG